ncbi:UvrD-helicase domain-containing protein [Propionivibrio soli]|uniref:UvrD-helicase domain-containing protein n=1 Tax=Propionivibrio soli TaxID=2976531 RepID=UPI0021E6E0A3
MADSPNSLIEQALNPSRSVVVEACAGSGKTWLLASRVVRLLLAGVAPGEILAITFTRKAAREIEERVVDWLHLLATVPEPEAAAFLAERGIQFGEERQETLRTARGLYERVLTAQPPLAVNTFHGWFLQLVDAAPLSANLAGATLVETDSRVFDELWQTFAAVLQKSPEAKITQSFIFLLDTVGLDATRRLVRRALGRRSEWQAYAAGEDASSRIVGELGELLGVEECGQALDDFFTDGWAADFQAYLGFLEMSELKTDQDAAAKLRAALAVETGGEGCLNGLCSALLTKEGVLRSRKPGAALDKRYTPVGAARFLELHVRLGESLRECVEKLKAERILEFNRHTASVFEAFLAHVDIFKKDRRQIDFVDAEWNVLRLLRDEETAAFVQARLDARYRHVLLDEFQDTNPLQWQILLAWLEAYSDAVRPVIFMVGDPKQSIYRFRRAEPRLFGVAADFLEREYNAVRCAQDTTRRNAQAIVDVVNALFLGVPEFSPFREQGSLAGPLPGRVELLPLCGKGDAPEIEERETLRNPLLEPDTEPEDLRIQQEAAALATKLGEIVGHTGQPWLIDERRADGQSYRRPARYGDIMLLVRARTSLASYEKALAAASIPFDAGSRGGLLTSLEARDVVALLEFLVMPEGDLNLAHALRSPLFGCRDDELLILAERREGSWWRRLVAVAASDDAPPRLARAARLLGDWLQASDRLPAHDLLDRIFHQGEVVERYRLAAPESSRAGVEANLRAMIALALDIDGGRYPSLPRFIDELRDLRDADVNDAPDEGAIDGQAAGDGRVRILTIHGAKGLEAPIVWLLGANGVPRAQEAWDLLVDWPPEDSAPRHVSFYGCKEDRGAARQAMFEQEAAAAKREELNLLYVAITRARQVFFASGIENARDSDETPYRRLEAAVRKLGGATAYGDEWPRAIGEPAGERAASEPSPAPAMPVVGERRETPDAAERFGILLHALLERRTGGNAQHGWWRKMGFSDPEYQRVVPVAERLLQAAPLQRFFDPTRFRRAWNEVELTSAVGEVRRIDRLVEFDDEIWVLDYKSSHGDTSRIADYREQVTAYCRTVSEVFPDRKARGMLVFSDASLVEV